jgi:hypothetical protein
VLPRRKWLIGRELGNLSVFFADNKIRFRGMALNTRMTAAGQRSDVAVSLRRALKGAGFLAGLATVQDDLKLEEVTVTGSRIARTDGFEAPTPVSVIGHCELDRCHTRHSR